MKQAKAVAIFLIFLLTAPNASALSDKEWAYAYALNHDLGKRALISLERFMLKSQEKFSEEYLDIFAEVMLVEANKQKPNLALVNTLRNILFKRGEHRYNTALLSVIDKSGQNNRKVRKFVAQETGTPQYIPGSVDLGKLKEEFDSYSLSSPVVPDGESKIKNLKPFTEYDDFIAIMGRPQAAFITLIHGGPGSALEQVAYLYKGVGKVIIELRDGEENKWVVSGGQASKFAFEPLMPHFKKDSSDPLTRKIILYSILHEDVTAIRTMSSAMMSFGSVDTELLDVFAELLFSRYKNALDKYEEDACSWIVKLLATKNGPRYRSLIELVANNNNGIKLTRHAIRFLENIESDELNPYKPGSVNIEKLKKEYLWPYGQSASKK